LSEGLMGLEYKADCWIFRVVAQRIPTATGKSTSTLFFQLELRFDQVGFRSDASVAYQHSWISGIGN